MQALHKIDARDVSKIFDQFLFSGRFLTRCNENHKGELKIESINQHKLDILRKF